MRSNKRIIYGILLIIGLLVIMNLNTIFFIFDFFTDQVKLILNSEDIDSVEADEGIEYQLKLIPKIMEFGDYLGFPHTNSYSRYVKLDRDVMYYSLTASRKDKFEEYLWRWPIIGSLPYKGFIDMKDVLKEEEKLKSEGYDTNIGESIAVSTLGYFPDPIVSIMINSSHPSYLIDTIYHERTHQLFFAKNQVVFNENSAVLLGGLSALEFIRSEFGNESSVYETQSNMMNDIIVFSKFIDEFYDELSILYDSDLSSEEKVIDRKSIFFENVEKFKTVNKTLHKSFKSFGGKEINNAYIISLYTYYGKVHTYYRVYERLGDLKRTIDFFKETSERADPDRFIENFIN